MSQTSRRERSKPGRGGSRDNACEASGKYYLEDYNIYICTQKL